MATLTTDRLIVAWCRDVATPAVATRLLGAATNARHENWMDASTKLGVKATVGAGCIVAAGCTVGDKSTLKRSVVGRGVTIGRDIKVPILRRLPMNVRVCVHLVIILPDRQ